MKRLWKNREWRLLFFHGAMTRFAVCLVLCALAAGLFRETRTFMFASCAAAALLLLSAWLWYCRFRDGKIQESRLRVPWMLQRTHPSKPHRPAFLMDSRDFDDDLTPYTTLAEDHFSSRELLFTRSLSSLAASCLMLAVSFLPGL